MEEKKQGKSKIGYPLCLQELKNNVLTEMWDEVLEDKLLELKSGEQASMATRPKLIQAGYTTLDSIPRIKKGSGTRFYYPALKGVDSKTQEQVSKWIQLLHKHPAHLHVLDIKDTQKQRDPGIEPLAGMHQEITRVILCRLIYIVMSFKPFNDIIMIVCKFLIGLCCLRSYST